MSVEQLETVVAIAEEGAIVRAARRLHISQPPLTRRLAALEDELGVKLFERLPRGMRPTPAGDELVGRARAILVALDEAKRAVRLEDEAAGQEACGPSVRRVADA